MTGNRDQKLAPVPVTSTFPQGWQLHVSPAPPAAVSAQADMLVFDGPANCYAYAELAMPANARCVQCAVNRGSDRADAWGLGMLLEWSDRRLRINVRNDGRLGLTDCHQTRIVDYSARSAWTWLRLGWAGNQITAEASGDGRLWALLDTFSAVAAALPPSTLRIGKLSHRLRGENCHICGPKGLSYARGIAIYSCMDELPLFYRVDPPSPLPTDHATQHRSRPMRID